PELQDYFVKCKEDNADAWFSFFLHYYEPRLNAISSGIVTRYGLRNQFIDVKTVYVSAMWEELQRYSLDTGVPFLTFSLRGIWREIHNHIRENCRPFSGISEYRDKALRRIIYEYDKLKAEYGESEAVKQISEKHNIKEETVYEYLAEADANTRVVPLCKQCNDEGTDDIYGGGDVTCDTSPTPEEQVIFAEMSNRLFDAFYSLEYADRVILAGRAGFCEQCRVLCKPLSFEELATMFEMSGAGGAEKRFARAAEKMRKMYYGMS
ncbi:MAG TPA: hypothetical protein PLT66_08000, partial [Bacillota bacterium]|nr:hypothetical protein [Bacillota bacterium]